MSQIEGIIKERYTGDEIDEDIETLIQKGILNPEDGNEEIKKVAREFYFRGLVHGHAQKEKVKEVREDFGY